MNFGELNVKNLDKVEEVWKDIEGLDGYQVSNQGKVKGPEKILKLQKTEKGYNRIKLKNKKYYVHRLVAATFISNPCRKPQVNHKDGDKENNSVENLEWATNSENSKHAVKHGLYLGKLGPRGTSQHLNKLSEQQVRSIKEEFKTMPKKGKLTFLRSLAIKYKVSFGAIANIYYGNTWSWLN